MNPSHLRVSSLIIPYCVPIPDISSSSLRRILLLLLLDTVAVGGVRLGLDPGRVLSRVLASDASGRFGILELAVPTTVPGSLSLTQ